MVAGDFTGNGRSDIAIFYDNGIVQEMHVFVSNGSTFVRQTNTWFVGSNYNMSRVAGLMVAGDFTGNGRSDIAIFYNNQMHVFVSTGSTFVRRIV